MGSHDKIFQSKHAFQVFIKHAFKLLLLGNDALDKAVKSNEAQENIQNNPQVSKRLVSFTRNFVRNIQNEIENNQQKPRWRSFSIIFNWRIQSCSNRYWFPRCYMSGSGICVVLCCTKASPCYLAGGQTFFSFVWWPVEETTEFVWSYWPSSSYLGVRMLSIQPKIMVPTSGTSWGKWNIIFRVENDKPCSCLLGTFFLRLWSLLKSEI